MTFLSQKHQLRGAFGSHVYRFHGHLADPKQFRTGSIGAGQSQQNKCQFQTRRVQNQAIWRQSTVAMRTRCGLSRGKSTTWPPPLSSGACSTSTSRMRCLKPLPWSSVRPLGISMVSTRALLPRGPRSTDSSLKAALGTKSRARSLGLVGCPVWFSLAHTCLCTTCRVTRVGLENGACFEVEPRRVRVTTAQAVRKADDEDDEDDGDPGAAPPPSLAAKAATRAFNISSCATASLQSLKLS